VLAHLTWLLTEGRRHRGWRRRLRLLRRLAHGSREAFAAWQQRALDAHVAWACRTIPYWRARADGARDLRDLQILTRRELQAHAEALRDPTRPVEALRRETSGGSTGEPVVLWHDDAYWSWECATEAFVHEWWGVRPWSRTAVLWGDDREAGSVGWKERLVNRALGRRTLNVFDVGPGDAERFLDALRRWRPEVLQGYVSALDLLAAHVGPGGDPGWRPQVVRSAAETLDPARRARIQAAFGVPVRDMYGSRESASLAANGPDGRLYVLGHGRVLEIVDADGAPVPPGVPGRVLVTDLTNRAFGLLRYENGDVASWAQDAGAAPWPFPVLERVWGRTSDFLTTPDGRLVHGEWFTHLFYGREDVRRFQVLQPRAERVEVRTEGPATQGDLAPLLSRVRAHLGPAVEVVWQPVPRIEPTPSGKHRFTISHVPFPGTGA
jgi:phenylacetate-CoA ligase